MSCVEAEGRFGGQRGGEIFWRSWTPEGEIAGAVVIVHGFGEHSGRYEHVAERLSDGGWSVFALDHHGHGRSEGPRALVSFSDALADLHTLVERAVSAHQAKPVVLLGHSMGGALALRYALAHPECLAGLILSGPLAEVQGRGLAKTVGRLLGRWVPRAPVARLDPALVSRDPAVVEAYRWDPLVHHGAVPAGTAAEFLAHAATLPADVSRIELPTLLLYGTADRLCAPRGSEMIAARIGSQDLKVVPLEGLYHEILNEPERDRALDEIEGWLEERFATRSDLIEQEGSRS